MVANPVAAPLRRALAELAGGLDSVTLHARHGRGTEEAAVEAHELCGRFIRRTGGDEVSLRHPFAPGDDIDAGAERSEEVLKCCHGS